MPGSGDWPELDNFALPRVWAEMPTEAASMAKNNRKVRPMNWLEKEVFGGASAITHPNGTIVYNRDNAEAAAIRPEDLLAHELTHVGQIDKRGGVFAQIVKQLIDASTPYLDRQDEIDAYAKENEKAYHRRRLKDVDLPREK